MVIYSLYSYEFKQLQLSLKIGEDYAFINRYQSYKLQLSGICSHLLFDQIDSDICIQTFTAYDDMMKYPLTEQFKSCIQPFSNLLLFWRERIYRKDIMEKIIEIEESILGKMAKDAIEIFRRPEARNHYSFCF